MKRQTRLTPAEGGRFAGPVGSPVPPNDADRGRASDAQVEAANNTLRRLDKMLEEHGCEMLQRDNMFHWVVIKGDKVLMRIPRAKLELASLEETAVLVEEVLTREAASREDMLEMLDAAEENERKMQVTLGSTRALLDITRRDLDLAKSELDKTQKFLSLARHERDQALALLSSERKERRCSEHGCQRKAVIPSTPDPPDFVRNARRARAFFTAGQPINYDMGPPVGFVSTRVRPEVGSMGGITDGGDPVNPPTLRGVPVLSSEEVPNNGTIYAVTKMGPGIITHESGIAVGIDLSVGEDFTVHSLMATTGAYDTPTEGPANPKYGWPTKAKFGCMMCDPFKECTCEPCEDAVWPSFDEIAKDASLYDAATCDCGAHPVPHIHHRDNKPDCALDGHDWQRGTGVCLRCGEVLDAGGALLVDALDELQRNVGLAVFKSYIGKKEG